MMVLCGSSPTLFLSSDSAYHSNGQQCIPPPPPPKLGPKEMCRLIQQCKDFKQLKIIHGKILRHHLFTSHIVMRKLLGACFSLDEMDYAALLFDHLRKRPVYTWNFMIRALSLHGNPHKAIILYNLMISETYPPDKFTFPFVIKACSAVRAVRKGKEVHGFAIKTGFIKDTYMFHTLMNFYFKCGDVKDGRKVFDKMFVRNVVSWTTLVSGLIACGELDAASEAFQQMPVKNVITWTALIDGYIRSNQSYEAFELFKRMQLDNVRPNAYTLVSLLKASAQLGSLKLGRMVHSYIVDNQFEIGVFLGTALIDMYCKCRSLKDAREVFDKMENKNAASWNAMITGLGVQGYGEEALALFTEMEVSNVRPDAITFVTVLCACVQMKDVERGHRYFTHMQEHYGIEPILEHENCMIELHKRANL